MGVGQALLVLASGPATMPSPHPAPTGSVVSLGSATVSGATSQVNATLNVGDAILVAYIHAGNDTAVVSDDGGNDYSTNSGTTTLTIVNYRVGWAFATITTPATFVNVTYSGGHANVLRVFRLGGLVSVGALDKSASARNESAQPNSGPTGVLSQKDELAFEITAFTSNAGWAADFAHDLGKVDAATIVDIGAAWKQTTSVASVTAAPTLSPLSRNWCVALTFKLA
jgi:hypothetical protein